MESSKPSRRPLDPRRRFLFLLVLIGLFAIGQELVLRLIFPVPEVANFNRVRYSQTWFEDGDKPTGYLANTAYKYGSSLDQAEFVHSLNLYGFRDRDWTLQKPAGTTRVAFLGDSFMEGAMAPDDSTIAEGFRHAAAAKGDRLDVMNLGVQATGPIEYMMIAGDAVPLFRPDHVVIVFYENDFYNPPSEGNWPLDGTIRQPRFNSPWVPRIVQLMRNLAERKPNPKRWRGRPFNFFKAAPDPSNPMAHADFVEQVSAFVDPDIRAAMAAGTFNPFVANLYVLERESLPLPINLSAYLLAFQEWLAERDANLLLAYIPINHQISDAYLQHHARFCADKQPHSLRGEPYRIHPQSVATICEVLDIPFLDLSPKLEALENAGHRLYWNYDNHMRGESYHLVGELLHEWFHEQTRQHSP